MKLSNHVLFTHRDLRHFCTYRFIFGIAYSFMIPVIPLFFDSLGMTTVMIGMFMSLYGVSKTLVQMPFGVVSDKIGDKLMLIIALGFMTLVPLAYTFSTEHYMSGSIYVVQGAVLGMAAPATFSVLARSLDSKRRGQSTGLASAVFTIGGGIGALVGGMIVARLGNYKMVFYLSALWIFFTLLYVALQIKKGSVKAVQPKKSKGLGEAWAEIKKYKLSHKIIVLGSIAFLGDFIYGCVVALFHFYGADVLGATTTYTSAIISIYLLVFGFGAPIAGWVSDRIGNRKQLFLSFMAMNATLLGLAFIRNIPLFTVVIILYFLGATFLNAALQSSLSEFGDNPKIKGLVFGFVGSSESLGYAMGPFICSYLYEFNPAWLFLGLLCVSTLISFIYLGLNKKANI